MNYNNTCIIKLSNRRHLTSTHRVISEMFVQTVKWKSYMRDALKSNKIQLQNKYSRNRFLYSI